MRTFSLPKGAVFADALQRLPQTMFFFFMECEVAQKKYLDPEAAGVTVRRRKNLEKSAKLVDYTVNNFIYMSEHFTRDRTAAAQVLFTFFNVCSSDCISEQEFGSWQVEMEWLKSNHGSNPQLKKRKKEDPHSTFFIC